MTLRSSIASFGSNSSWICFSRRFEPVAQLAPLLVGDLAHLGIGVRIVDQGLDAAQLRRHRTIGLDRIHDRTEVRQFARQLDEFVGRKLAGQPGFDFGVTHDQRVEFGLRQHGSSYNCKFSDAANCSMRWRNVMPVSEWSSRGPIAASAFSASSSSSMDFTGPTAEGVSDSER